MAKETNKAFGFCSSSDVSATFIPSHLSMFINRESNIALWESVYVHETIHSLLTDTLNGWWIQILEDISNNMFVVFRRGEILSEKLVSWIFNLEFKKRKLMESWLQTQEGFATYFQLDVVDIEKRAIEVATELSRLRHKNLTGEEMNQIQNDAREIRRKWVELTMSRNCPLHYRRGYELVAQIARKFGKDNLAPIALVACSPGLQGSLVSQNVDDFQAMISQENCNVDKRLELISKIPESTIKGFPLINDWTGLAKSIHQCLGEEPLEEVDFWKMIRESYTNSLFPKGFVDITKAEMPDQFKAARKRWNNLKMKGIDSSQLVAVFNVVGEVAMMAESKPVNTADTSEALAITYRTALNGLDKMEFINDVLRRLRERGGMEQWMEMLQGLGDLTRFKEMIPIGKLLSIGEACCLCHSHTKYSNPGLMCPHSSLIVCFNCCLEMECSNCEEFNVKSTLLPEINKIVESYSYEL